MAGFGVGQTIRIDTGTNLETAVIATVGTPGATTAGAPTAAGATVIQVPSLAGFNPGQAITIGSGADYETAVVASASRFPVASITPSAISEHKYPLTDARVTPKRAAATIAMSSGCSWMP